MLKNYTHQIQKLEDEHPFLRISHKQMTVLKSAITSLKITIQKVNRNEKIWGENQV